MIKDDIIGSLAALNDADFVISNDTGMYHAAGALDKRQFVMWKDTNKIKNSTPSKKAYISNDWIKDFKKWI